MAFQGLQYPQFVGITVTSTGGAKPVDQKRLLGLEESAKKKGAYWKAELPIKSSHLKLSNAEQYVAKSFATQPPDNHFVYLQEHSVAGLVRNISQIYMNAGFSGMTEDYVRRNSLDPLSDQGRAQLASLGRAARHGYDPSKRSADDQFMLNMIKVGQYIQYATKDAAAKKSGKPLYGLGTGSKSDPNVKRQRAIEKFTVAMDNEFRGVPNAKWFNVTNFDVRTYSKITETSPAAAGPITGRGMTYYEVTVEGRKVRVPLKANLRNHPESAKNYRDYVNAVVRSTKYAFVVPELLAQVPEVAGYVAAPAGYVAAPAGMASPVAPVSINILPSSPLVAEARPGTVSPRLGTGFPGASSAFAPAGVQTQQVPVNPFGTTPFAQGGQFQGFPGLGNFPPVVPPAQPQGSWVGLPPH